MEKDNQLGFSGYLLLNLLNTVLRNRNFIVSIVLVEKLDVVLRSIFVKTHDHPVTTNFGTIDCCPTALRIVMSMKVFVIFGYVDLDSRIFLSLISTKRYFIELFLIPTAKRKKTTI